MNYNLVQKNTKTFLTIGKSILCLWWDSSYVKWQTEKQTFVTPITNVWLQSYQAIKTNNPTAKYVCRSSFNSNHWEPFHLPGYPWPKKLRNIFLKMKLLLFTKCETINRWPALRDGSQNYKCKVASQPQVHPTEKSPYFACIAVWAPPEVPTEARRGQKTP